MVVYNVTHRPARGKAEYNHFVALDWSLKIMAIARISYGMLKNGTRYEPYRWRDAQSKRA